jgi:hypothetical protein
MNKKVYCVDCKYWRYWRGCKEEHKIKADDYLGIYYTYNASIKNKNNNCKYFEEK